MDQQFLQGCLQCIVVAAQHVQTRPARWATRRGLLTELRISKMTKCGMRGRVFFEGERWGYWTTCNNWLQPQLVDFCDRLFEGQAGLLHLPCPGEAWRSQEASGEGRECLMHCFEDCLIGCRFADLWPEAGNTSSVKSKDLKISRYKQTKVSATIGASLSTQRKHKRCEDFNIEVWKWNALKINQ